MTIDRSGTWWKGSQAADLDEYLIGLSAGEHPVTHLVHAHCEQCGGDTFRIWVDDPEACARRSCVHCGEAEYMLDSDEVARDATLTPVVCPCGGTTYQVAAGFATRESGDPHWVYIGLRCATDGTLGAPADWCIERAPADRLFSTV